MGKWKQGTSLGSAILENFGETGVTSWVNIPYKSREALLHCRIQVQRGEPTYEGVLVIHEMSHGDGNAIPASVRSRYTILPVVNQNTHLLGSKRKHEVRQPVTLGYFQNPTRITSRLKRSEVGYNRQMPWHDLLMTIQESLQAVDVNMIYPS